jgi:hypothetical protein
LVYLPPPLLEVLSREDTVVFVGAGASVWAGLPTWPQLIKELAEFIERTGASAEIVKRELAANDLLQAASYGVDLLMPSEFGRFIRTICRRDSAQPAEIHKLIAALKPACFITTNYDQLLEQAIRRTRPNAPLLVVSNRQLTETADIVQARAKNFVFKPHGDVDDVEAVVLTREHYRALRYQRPHVIHALETLLVSRSVVFVGFGLRDPDFFLVKEFLIETYHGAARDHYAIVADATTAETDYWRRQYGIHLISYTTSPSATGRDHTALLELLRLVASVPGEPTPIAIDRAIAPLLAQYAARIASLPLEVAEQELPLRVRRRGVDSRIHQRDESLSEFIADSGRVALLIGAPGAGKTYSIRRYVMSQALAILSNPARPDLDVPIYVDMKLYRGNLWQLAEEQLPEGLTLVRLSQIRHVKFFVDAVNEMPQQYVEDGRFHADLAAFMRHAHGAGIIATSRSEQGLTTFGAAVFDLDSLAIDYVQKYLAQAEIAIAQQWQGEILDLLRKPLFFRLFAQHTELFRNLTTPNAFYERLFLRIGDSVQQRTSIAIDLVRALSKPAFEAIDAAHELMPAESILGAVGAFLPGLPKAARREDAIRVFNALLGEGILVAHPHGQVSLFHQTATEYLAAPRLARVIADDVERARRILRRTHWDHSFLLALDRVPRQVRRAVFMSVLHLDRSFAGRAVRYMSFDSGWAAVKFLEALDESRVNPWEIIKLRWIIRNLPATRTTRDSLLALAAQGGMLGGAAVESLASQPPSRPLRSRLTRLILNHVSDYNFGSLAASALGRHFARPELEAVFRQLKDLPLDVLDYDAVTKNCAGLLKSRPLADALPLLEQWDASDRVREGVIVDVLFGHLDDEFELVVKEALGRVARGSRDAIFLASIAIRKPRIDRDLLESLVTPELIDALIAGARERETGEFAARALRVVGTVPVGQNHVARAAENTEGLTRAILLLACGESACTEFWREMEVLSRRRLDLGDNYHLIKALSSADWAGHLDVLFRFFQTNGLAVAEEFLEFMRLEKSDLFSQLFEGDKLDWWLPLFESSASDWQKMLLGEVIATGSPMVHQRILGLFNTGAFRRFLVMHVVPRLRERTTEDLNEDAISWLIANAEMSPGWPRSSALGAMATEDFVNERLMPALRVARGRRRAGLLSAIHEAGERHGRRYVDEQGQALPVAQGLEPIRVPSTTE